MTEHAEQGWSVAISANGDTAIVGAPAYNSFAGRQHGYNVRSGSTWTEQAKLDGKEAAVTLSRDSALRCRRTATPR